MIPGQFFKTRFSYTPPRLAHAAGSLILLGQGAEINQGLSLSTAVSTHVKAAGSPAQGGKIDISHAGYQDTVRLHISRIDATHPLEWPLPLQQVLRHLQSHGVPLRAGQLAFESSIPARDWMGGQAALLVAFCLIYREMYPYALTDTGSSSPPQRNPRGILVPPGKIEKMALANICSRVTRHSQPALDHLAYPLTSLFGQSWQALEIDFQTQSIEPVPLSPDHVLIAAIPRLPLPATAPSRSEFERLGQSIAQTIGVKSLRSLDGKTLTSQEKKLSAHESAYAIHVTRENQRVIHAAQALRQGDFPQFGQYLLQSHESARDRLGLSRPELDRLVEVAQSHKACLGSRFLGSHQGSATVHVVERRRKEDFIQHLQKRYPVEPGDFVKPLALECTPDLPA